MASWAGTPTAKDLEKAVEGVNYVETAQTGISLSGYVDAGYVYNFIGGSSRVATTGYDTDAVAKGDFNLNAVKLVLEKPLSEANEFQAGFRVDLMFGEDAAGFSGNAAAPGSSSSIYVQQGLVMVRVPVGNGLGIEVGRIGSLLGFEADERPSNLNITQGLNASLDPGPSNAVRFTYPASEWVNLKVEVNNGNGLSTSTGINDGAGNFESHDSVAFVAALGVVNPKGNAETQLAFHVAPWGDEGFDQQDNEPLYGLNWWGTWAPTAFQDRLLLAFNASYWVANDFARGAALGPETNDSANFVTVALYAKYQFTPVFSLAGRMEYTHTDDDQFLNLEPGLAPVQGSSDIWGWTLTAGFDILENVLLRTEYRFDFGNDVVSSNGGNFNDNQAHTIAAQVVYSF
jgi:hypothetical protein